MQQRQTRRPRRNINQRVRSMRRIQQVALQHHIGHERPRKRHAMCGSNARRHRLQIMHLLRQARILKRLAQPRRIQSHLNRKASAFTPDPSLQARSCRSVVTARQSSPLTVFRPHQTTTCSAPAGGSGSASHSSLRSNLLRHRMSIKIAIAIAAANCPDPRACLLQQLLQISLAAAFTLYVVATAITPRSKILQQAS